MTAATDSARTDAAAQGWRTQSCSAVVLQDTKSTHSSALLASCRAQSSSAARVRKGAPSAQAVSLFAARSSQRKHSMRRKAFHLSPAQRKKIFNGWSEGPFQVEGGEAEKGSGKCAQMARPIIPAMPRATGLSCGNARIGHGTRRVAAVLQQLACCGRIPAHGCSCRLRAGRCCCHRRCGHQGREREPIRGDYMSLASDSLGCRPRELSRLVQAPALRGFRKGVGVSSFNARTVTPCFAMGGQDVRLHRSFKR